MEVGTSSEIFKSDCIENNKIDSVVNIIVVEQRTTINNPKASGKGIFLSNSLYKRERVYNNLERLPHYST